MSIRDRFYSNDTRESASQMHKKVWGAIRKSRFLKNWLFLQEQTISTENGSLYVDMLCNSPIKVAIEIQGEQHEKFVKHFHTTYSDFKKQQERDRTKENWLTDKGYKLIKFYYDEKLTDDEIVKKILEGIK